MATGDSSDSGPRGGNGPQPEQPERERGDDLVAAALRAEAAACAAKAPQSDSTEPDPALDELFAAVRSELDAERGLGAWLRSRPTLLRRAIVAAGAVAVVALTALTWGRVDAPQYPALRLGLELLVYAVVCFGVLSTALRREPQPVGGHLALFAIAVGLLIPFVTAMLPIAHALHPESLVGAGDDLWMRALPCFIWGLGAATPIALLMALAARAPGADQPRDALFGVSAGVAGVLALQVHCPITQPIHLAVGHATVVAGMLVAYNVVRRMAPARR